MITHADEGFKRERELDEDGPNAAQCLPFMLLGR